MSDFPKRYRIKTKNDFGAVLKNGEKFVSSRFVVLAIRSPKQHARLGVVVSKKIGNAVVRNKVKRKFREIFRQSCSQNIPGHHDIVIIARKIAPMSTYKELTFAVLQSFQWLKGKLA